MCGIGGVFQLGGDALSAELAAAAGRISARMADRGPDGAGTWSSPEGDVAFVHRRLSIIDLSERAAQPMVSEDGALAITFNGEIYNYQALRAELEAKGRRFRTSSDTEVLLQLYAERGVEMLPLLRGMFAFAIWDQRRGGMLLARDPYGIKPLFYASDARGVWFASQVKALLASDAIARDVDPAGVVGFHLFGSVPEPFSWYRAIRALPAGSSLWVDGRGAAEPRAYFSLAGAYRAAAEQTRVAATDDGADAEVMRESLLDSVRAHLVADVPVGAFLSSGIDSGALLGLMSEASATPIHAITLAFDEHTGRAEDEAPLAREIAERYGAVHRVRRVEQRELIDYLPRIFAAMDQPSIDGLNTWLVSKAAHEVGLKVAVSGLGGDELWGGYPAFRELPQWTRLLRWPARVPRLGRALRRAAAPALPHTRLSPKLGGLVELGGELAGAYLLRRGLFMPWELDQVLDPELVRAGLERLDPVAHIRAQLEQDPGTEFGRIACLEAGLYMRNQLLRDSDWASMAHSLEVRVPLVDPLLLRAVAPLVLRAGGLGKEQLARSPRPALPEHIIARPKTGFTTPIARWLERSDALDAWRRVPALRRAHCHWSRRFAHVVAVQWSS
jgi:asparagine synthase (glutamine-hydrolysing)